MSQSDLSSAGANARAAIEKDQSAFFNFLSRYVQHPSVAPKVGDANVRECQHWLASELRSWGWAPWIDTWEEVPGETNLAVRIPGLSGEARLMFNGHTDVVPVPQWEVDDWRFPPFSGHIADGCVWGRGTSDMKGGVAAFLWAAKTILDLDIALEHDLLLTANIGEESARTDIGIKSVLERGYIAPVVVNAEPSNLGLYRAAMGWLFFEVVVEGKSTHPANRYLCLDPAIAAEDRPGADANDKMRLIINALAELGERWVGREPHPLAPPRSTNLTLVHIEGGERSAALAGRCSATYAAVFDPNMTSEEVSEAVRACVDEAARKDEWMRAHPPTVNLPVVDPIWEPMETAADTPGANDLLEAATAALGEPPRVGSFPGPCDANVIAKSGVDTLIFGPGDLGFGCHGTNECVPVSHLTQACEVYARMILRRCCI